MSTQQLTYFQLLNMSREMYGLGAIGAGAGQHVTDDFGTYVGGGTAFCVGLPLAFKGAKGVIWDMPKWAIKNHGNYAEAFKATRQNWKEINFGEAVKAKRNFLINGAKGNGIFGGIRNMYNIQRLQKLEGAIPKDIKTGFDKSKYYKLKQAGKLDEAEAYLKKFKEQKTAKINKNEIYKPAKEKIAEIKNGIKNKTLKGKDLQKAVSELDKTIAKCDKEALSHNIKPTSKLGKIKAGLSKYSGAKAVNSALTKGIASNSKAISGMSKAAKGFIKGGGAITAAVEFGFEVPEIIQTFKECGTGKGMKQIGKSATVAVASGAGYAAGAALGGKIGAAVGTCIGGPIGTVVGGAIGIACGLIGSWICGKVAKEIVGKSEIAKKQEKDAMDLTKTAYEDPAKQKELLDAYEQMINQRDEMVEEGVEDTPQTADVQTSKYPEEEAIMNELTFLG